MTDRPIDALADHRRDDTAMDDPDRAPGDAPGRVDAPVGGPSDGAIRGGSPRRIRGRSSSDRSYWEEAATVLADRVSDGFETIDATVRGRGAFGAQPTASVRLPDDVVEAIAAGRLAGREGGVADWLGLTETDEGTRMVAFEPGATRAWLVGVEGRRTELERVHGAGVFAGPVPGPADQSYRLEFEADGHAWERHDSYAYGKVLGDFDVHLLAEGSHGGLDAVLGAHPTQIDGVDGTRFALWAPNATRVAVIGDFNGWDERRDALSKRGGVWEGFVPGAHRGQGYMFAVHGPNGERLPNKADPLAFQQSVAPEKHSIIHGLPSEMGSARRDVAPDRPVSIYEVHLGSWQRGEGDRFLNYDEIADRLVPYCRDMGFTHVELMPVSAHPFTGSWGYQPICLFAPDGRFGDPEGFQRLVGRAHEAGLGVIVDWVPAHFPSDPHGLAEFDGTALYEHPDPRRGFHKDWNTLIYDFGRPEVSNFLTANAVHWLQRYGVDALRVDAVASMLYLDYSREAGEWVPNVHGGRENLEAVALIHCFTTACASVGRATIAEESTAWPGVSRPIDRGGLGFDFKWNMGWMHDTLDYMSEDPAHRGHHHHKMTFGIHYGFTENFVLPLSHDEVVHGKGSLIGKMPGDDWQRFANLRAYFGFMWTHPGKKLLFMGGEFAQEREWNHDRSLDWHLMDDARHRGVNRLVRDLNHLYRDTPELHELDCEERGFAWIEGGDATNSVFSYERRAKDGRTALVIVNMTPTPHYDYRIGVPEKGAWREFMNTDAPIYGGSGVGNMGRVMADGTPAHGRPASAPFTIPPLAAMVFLRDPPGDEPDAEEPEAIEHGDDVTNPDPDAEELKAERETRAKEIETELEKADAAAALGSLDGGVAAPAVPKGKVKAAEAVEGSATGAKAADELAKAVAPAAGDAAETGEDGRKKSTLATVAAVGVATVAAGVGALLGKKARKKAKDKQSKAEPDVASGEPVATPAAPKKGKPKAGKKDRVAKDAASKDKPPKA